MGKASRSKRERSREKAGQWTAAGAARAAKRMKDDGLLALPGNPWVRASLAANLNNVMGELFSVLPGGDESAWDLACAMLLGKQGVRPPWPSGPQAAADWQTRQAADLFREAEVLVVSPAAHAAVMAAAATLEPADVSTLRREQDVVMPVGLLVLPEPVVTVNRAGSLSDTAAFGWQFIVQHQVQPTATYPGVRVTTFMDRDGPVQPVEWQLALAQARASGSPLPRLVPDGMYGMRGDGCFADESAERLAELTAEHRRLQSALNEVAQWRAEPVPEVGEWGGGEQIVDTYDDFACRYMFAFWRLAAQGVMVTHPTESSAGIGQVGEPYDPEVRVIRLARQVPAPRTGEQTEAARARVYHHRWPVRMHKVRQWYPSAQEHRVIWRGPYIKGPADAPLMVGEKVYVVDN
ncbi:hypothetical protein [Streptomyces sp. NPDC050485]|uniref:hypothetical protein n=1 Tax=Streptomyces sp. NPDC050485 TaxID=3365617 RepID=UPI00379BB85A